MHIKIVAALMRMASVCCEQLGAGIVHRCGCCGCSFRSAKQSGGCEKTSIQALSMTQSCQYSPHSDPVCTSENIFDYYIAPMS